MKRTGWGFFLSVLFLIAGIFNASAANIALDIPPNIPVGQMFDVNVIINPEGEHIAGVQLNLEYNPSSILINSITEGNFLKQSGINTFFNKGTIDNSNGKAEKIYGAILGIGNVTTPGTFIIISATSIQSINSKDLTVTNVLMVDPEGGQVYPIPTPKPTDQTQTSVMASGDEQVGGSGGTSSESLQSPIDSNKNLYIAAFVGIIIIFIIVYKYVIPKYSASKGVVTDIGKQNNKVNDIVKRNNVAIDIGKQNNEVIDIGKQNNILSDIVKENKITKTTRKKLNSIIHAEASDSSIKNIAADMKISESVIKKVRAPKSKDHEPIQVKKTSKKKKVTGKNAGKPAA